MAVAPEAIERLHRAYGAQGWWPAATGDGPAAPWEVVVGAVLVQHATWKSVVRAIGALEAAGMMSVGAIDSVAAGRLAELVRPVGTPTVKAARLKAVARFLVDSFDGSVDALLAGVADRRVALERRERLLSVKGVGPETADAILLYAGGAPVFVVDAYKRRVMARHGWGDAAAKYDEVAIYWRRRLPADPQVYAEAHALLVRVGAEHCAKRAPRCEECPLRPMLPRGGPLAC